MTEDLRFQSAYDTYLRKAITRLWEAEEQLSRIGARGRQADDLDQRRNDIRQLVSELTTVWNRRYGTTTT